MSSKTSKVWLRNVIRHTDTHNKRWEETSMWQQREVSKKRSSHSPRFLGAHMDRHEEVEKRQYRGRNDEKDLKGSSSTFWMRQLHDAEEADPNRWGHSGFKELYPKQFQSTDSEQGNEDVEKRKHKSGKKRSPHKKRRRRKFSDTSSGSSSDEEDNNRFVNSDKHNSYKRSHENISHGSWRPLKDTEPAVKNVMSVSSRLKKPTFSETSSSDEEPSSAKRRRHRLGDEKRHSHRRHVHRDHRSEKNPSRNNLEHKHLSPRQSDSAQKIRSEKEEIMALLEQKRKEKREEEKKRREELRIRKAEVEEKKRHNEKLRKPKEDGKHVGINNYDRHSKVVSMTNCSEVNSVKSDYTHSAREKLEKMSAGHSSIPNKQSVSKKNLSNAKLTPIQSKRKTSPNGKVANSRRGRSDSSSSSSGSSSTSSSSSNSSSESSSESSSSSGSDSSSEDSESSSSSSS